MIKVQVNSEMFAYDMFHILKAFFPGEKIDQSMDTTSEHLVEITIEKETPAIALINGNSGFGQAVSYKAMQIAIKKAKEVGIGCVGVHNTNHFGVTGFYSDLALRENVIGMVIANTDPAIAPLGGKEALIGTNPLAIGIPSETYITVDMATSVTARGKIIESRRKGLDLPEGWALDKNGNLVIIENKLDDILDKEYPLAKEFARYLTSRPLCGTIFPQPGWTAADACRKAADEESPGYTGQG